MKRILALLSMVFLYSSLSLADVTINIVESGVNVVASASGTINFDQQFAGTSTSPGGFVSGNGFDVFENSQLHVGSAIDIVKFTADGDNAIFNNNATMTAADSNTGDHIGLFSQKPGFSDIFSVDLVYLNGEKSVDATSTWNNTDLATLGFIEGTYVFSANGVSTITLNIGAAPTTTTTTVPTTTTTAVPTTTTTTTAAPTTTTTAVATTTTTAATTTTTTVVSATARPIPVLGVFGIPLLAGIMAVIGMLGFYRRK